MLPRITVITPSFNQAAYLDQTIQSVLDQEYPNLEYFIVDGGSTDGSLDIVRKYAANLSWWISEKDRGQSHAINKGLRRATGDLVAYINSDDFYLKDAFRHLVEAYREYPDADIFHGRCRIVDENRVKLGERFGAINSYGEMLDLWDVWWKMRNFVQPEVFWTKRATDRVGFFREDLHWVMDYEYWLRIFRTGGKAQRIDTELACFRRQPNQKSTQPEKTAQELLNVVKPLIWEGESLSPMQRLRLRGKWSFDAVFRVEAMKSLLRGEPRWKRWVRLSLLTIRYPSIMTASQFQSRISNCLLK